MSDFVLDCSVAISWLMPDEDSSFSNQTLNLLTSQQAFVPSIWPLEVGNVLLGAERNKRITIKQRCSAISIINELPITIDPHTSKYVFLETMVLAERYKLTLYDASYLELAMRMNIPIATFDKQLKQAAHKEKVIILGEKV